MTRHHLLLALWLGAGLLSACAPYAPRETLPVEPVPPPKPRFVINDPASYPRNAEAASGPAVLKLLAQASTELAAGKADQSVATLELALNIEPRNPFVWQQLAATHLARHLPEEAEHVAIRSNSFARGNPWVEVGNWRTIATARTQRGDTAGAQDASEHYEALAARLAQ